MSVPRNMIGFSLETIYISLVGWSYFLRKRVNSQPTAARKKAASQPHRDRREGEEEEEEEEEEAINFSGNE